MNDRVQLNIQVPTELRTRAKIVAARQGQTLSELIQGVLEETLAELEDALEDAEIGPRAQAAYEEWLQDPSSSEPWDKVRAELVRDGRLDG